MSITISFSMKAGKKWLHSQERTRARVRELAEGLEEELDYVCDMVEDRIVCRFCPEGYLWMGWTEGILVGDCQTNIAGPGFHAAVIRFLEVFASKAGMKLWVEDETGYFRERDFAKMRQKYFHRWFKALMERVVERYGEDEMQLVCWPTDYYLPETKVDEIITHIRPFTIAELTGMLHSGMSMAFAKDFFVWNEEAKDAYYYRNCALVMMNQECYFMPSKRSDEDQAINQMIIRCLERALELDRRVPFPKKEYLELCRLDGREPVDIGDVCDCAEQVMIGCRRGMLLRAIGCLRFAVPGYFLYDTGRHGHVEHYYDGGQYGGHDYYICALNTEQQAGFQETPFEKDGVEAVHEFQVGEAQGRIAVYQPEEHDGDVSYAMSAQIIYKKQITIISIRYRDPDDYDWAMELIQKIQTID